jgi:hypothetical protein
MFRKVLSLLLGLAHSLDLTLDSEQVREACLKLLQSLAVAAGLTPGVWDDLVVKMAMAFCNSPYWGIIFDWLKSRVGATESVPQMASDEVALFEAFQAVQAA